MNDAVGYELQLSAMRSVMDALKPLDDRAREAVLAWVVSQLGVRTVVRSPQAGTESALQNTTAKREGTVSTVALKMGAKSARDLFLAAAVHLTLHQGKQSFTRNELVSNAKDARNWKANYSSQAARDIKRMMDAGTLFEKSKDVFSLSEEAIADAERKLEK